MERIRAYTDQHRGRHEGELAEWVAVPSISATGEGMTAATEYARDLIGRSGLTPSVVETGGWPLAAGRRGHHARLTALGG